jgi:hypothetical protein
MRVFSNGWVQIAGKTESDLEGSQTIIALTPSPDARDKYVVAHANVNETEWYWGTYYPTIERAVRDYSQR